MRWLGSPFKASQQIADVVANLATDVLQPSAGLGSAISNLVSVSVLSDARTQLERQTADASNTALAARIAPSLMGTDGPRTYFTGFQTNAKARGTEGLLGGFGIINFGNGKPTVDTLTPNTKLDRAFAPLDLEDQPPLEETLLAHVVPDDSAPYAAVIINDFGGNKLDHHLKRDIEYAADGRGGPTRNSTDTMKISCPVPPGLAEILAALNGPITSAPIKGPTGTMLTSVRLTTAKGAIPKSAVVNGQWVPVVRGTEPAHPTFEIEVTIPPRKSGGLAAHATEPPAAAAPKIPVQPLTDSATPSCCGGRVLAVRVSGLWPRISTSCAVRLPGNLPPRSIGGIVPQIVGFACGTQGLGMGRSSTVGRQ